MNLSEFQQQLKSHVNPVIVDVWAPWCLPCRVTKPVLESLAKAYEGTIDFWAVNADEHSQLLRELKIFSIPTVVITRNGEIIGKYTGTHSREGYRGIFKALRESGNPAATPVSGFDRFLRLFAAAAIVGVGLVTGTWLIILLGGTIAFLGIYDRCPIWRAITAYLNKRTP